MADDREPSHGPPATSARPITLGASLKLYLDVDASVAWARSLAEIARAHAAVLAGEVRLFILPSLPALDRVIAAVADAPIAVGAQDLFWSDRGAYTGAVSGVDLARLGCRYVEVGHAERRHVFGEDDEIIRRKLAAAVRTGLTPVLCVGEEERGNAALAASTCIAQIESATADAGDLSDLVVAYEPEWAIGQAEPASSAHVTEVVALVRSHLAQRGLEDASVIYGGSAKPGLLSTLGSSVDGLFLGRFAHDPHAFASIIDEAAGIR
ncbi:triose-phosphate isomerase family protein [Microbacterium murale]|uniref:Triosephosphate isomerase n=1 Tax=Microbacterium murale TaxID=1081040 RepID=A0ABU0PAC6_9MICO|nr:triose-phosphate isomerase family protein [Microbacterium murale]MDQ0644288.1 triosephosphate isomerase [Microbacterium murale]